MIKHTSFGPAAACHEPGHPPAQPGAQTRRNTSCGPVSRRLLSLCIMVALLPVGASAAEEEPPLGQITPNLRVLGELRGRYEVMDFFKPALNTATGVTANDNDYGFGALRARLGVSLTTPYIDGFAQGQYTGLYELPDRAFGGPPVGPLGTGGAYYRDSGSTNPGKVFLKQGWLSLKGEAVGLPGAALKGGRFEISDGMEYRTGDAKFDQLKASRVSQRLIGPFDFTHITRSFDGFALTYDQPAFNVTLTATHPTQGGFNIHAQDQISDIDLAYGALTSKRGALLPDTEARLFYIYYGDDRSVQPTDNRPLALRPRLSADSLTLSTIGTHLLSVTPVGPGSVDAMLWGAYQFGDWGNLNHSAYSVAAEAGYQWTDVFMKPWIRAGYSRSSGDDNANNGTHNTFFQVMPTIRPYAKFPFYSLMNLQDVFAQVIIAPTASTKLSVDFHHLSLAESRDLFYGGSGATSRAVTATTGGFGYFGRPSGGQGTVGQMVDVSFSHTINKYFSWNVYYAHAFGGDVLQNAYQLKNDADYAFIEFTTSF